MAVSGAKTLFYRSTPIIGMTSGINMDRKLLDILACPASRQPLALLDSAGIDALNKAIATGGVRRADDTLQSEPLREALLTRDGKTVYRIDDGIPVLLVEEGIATVQVDGFPSA